VTFRIARAESSGLEAASADLITVAQALHWFDISAFFAEANRVLKAGGVLAFWCYRHCEVDDAPVMSVFRQFLEEVRDYWPQERAIVEDEYPLIDTPFMDLPVDDFSMSARWTADELLAYIDTWSATRRYVAARGRSPVDIHGDAFRLAWGAGRRTVAWPIVLRACRKVET
jgi:SAM-dependent methyltransferase